MTSAAICLATIVYFEARSQSLRGQLYVADVVLNRVESKHYPNSVCGVMEQKHQFSFYWDGLSDKPKNKKAWSESMYVANWMLSSRKRYIDSCHYHSTKVNPYWSKSFKVLAKVGDHIFYTGDCK
jgi:spore germination cell wall hydrolase CwlJ-like protein